MIVKNVKIRCINLDWSTDRMSAVRDSFGDVIRIPAVDGMLFSDGTYDRHGCPKWSAVPDNVVLGYSYLFPTTYACNLSHIKAWKDFLASDEEWSIFIEDDVEKVSDISNLEISDDCDFFYLIGPDHIGCRMILHPDGQVKLPRTLAAYVMSRHAAELAIIAMDTHYFQADWQVPFRTFSSMKDCKIGKPEWDELPTIKAYGNQTSIVRHNRHAVVSTFTSHGRKPWLPQNLLPHTGELI